MDKDLKKEEMDSKIHENSEVPYHDEPAQNEFEMKKWNSNGYNQSGIKK